LTQDDVEILSEVGSVPDFCPSVGDHGTITIILVINGVVGG
jgi:hypothetical protein